jgi:hypothetical protein
MLLARGHLDRHRPDLLDQADLLRRRPHLARCEIAGFRYRVLHVAAQLVHSARQLQLRIDRHRRWADNITAGFLRLQTAFP